MKKSVIISLLIWACIRLQAQPIVRMCFRFEPTNVQLQKIFPSCSNIDSAKVENQVSNVLTLCYGQSFLLATESARDKKGDTLQITIQTGKPFLLKELRPGNVPSEWISASGFRYLNERNKHLLNASLTKGMSQLLHYAENNGYPFATLKLDSIIADSDGISASLLLEKNSLIYFDSIKFGGTASISQDFLQNYANIKPGTLYQEDLLKNLDSRLSELSYIQVARPMGVYFYGKKARPYVYINHRNASSFDGVIGFAPNSSLNNKLVITGDLNLKLVNILGSGKNLDLSYRGFLNNSQDLQIKFMWPYFLNTKLGIDYAFKLLKFDTTWLEIFNDIGLQYRFTGNNSIKVYYQYQNISLLNVDTQYVINNKKLPNISDVRNDLYGLAIRRSSLDYFFNPRKGYLLELEAGAGTKRIIRNSAINDLEISSASGNKYNIYDSTKLTSIQYKVQGNLSVYTKLSPHFVLLSQLKGAIIRNEHLFLNELFRIGGLKTLKGFDEQSIFANKYLIGNVELRYLFQQNSGFLLFWNAGWYRNEVLNPVVTDKPWGIGAGMNLETGAGIFSLYYAIGTQKGNPLEFQRAKVHFGLVNFF